MATYANTVVADPKDGIPYSKTFTITGTEGDLFNQSAVGPDPVPMVYGQAVEASVQLVASGSPASNSSYVILQTDLNDGIWIDLAGCLWTGTTGTVTFSLSAGAAGANAFQQSRASGTAPSANFSNQCPLGARFRFVGQATLSGGTAPAVKATISYKILALR